MNKNKRINERKKAVVEKNEEEKEKNGTMDIQEDMDHGDNDDDDDDDDDDEWEDIDDTMDEEVQDEEMYDAYEDEIAKFGFEVTELGELIFPNGKIIGHRALSRYYKQRFTPTNTNPAVLAAKVANSERLYKGRVYQLSNMMENGTSSGGGTTSTLAISKSGGLNRFSTLGRAGGGILVPSTSSSAIVGGRFNFTALSLYRFQAVMKKARKDEFRARRQQQRTRLPINKMDKKANRMFNNISIAHCRD